VLHERGKFGAKIFSHCTDIVIVGLGYFNLAHAVLLTVACRWSDSYESETWALDHLYYTCSSDFYKVSISGQKRRMLIDWLTIQQLYKQLILTQPSIFTKQNKSLGEYTLFQIVIKAKLKIIVGFMANDGNVFIKRFFLTFCTFLTFF